jgi:hypothetical protein
MKASKTALALVLGLATTFAFAAAPATTASATNATAKTKCEKGQHHDAAGTAGALFFVRESRCRAGRARPIAG